MSISIATMGKFTPATGATRIVTQVIDSGSSYGGDWNKMKPQVIVNTIDYDREDRKPEVLVTNIEEN
jgi:hypothetical protein